MHFLLHYSHHATAYDGGTDLYPDSVFCRAPESLDLEMLLQPYEEQSDFPFGFVWFRYLKCGNVKGIRNKKEPTGSPIDPILHKLLIDSVIHRLFIDSVIYRLFIGPVIYKFQMFGYRVLRKGYCFI